MRFTALAALLTLTMSAGFAQQSGSADSGSSSALSQRIIADSPSDGGALPGGAIITAPAATAHSGPFSGFALGFQAGVLGLGFEAATPLVSHLNLRGGANFFNYNDTLTNDGISYNANLRFRSVDAGVDWFPWSRGFHISPGALLYNGNQVTAIADVPVGSSFTLNNYTYTSSATDPVSGTGSLKFNKAAPKITVGWGNMLPRNGAHLSVPVELGFAYVGDPKTVLNLTGTACYNYQGQNYCSDVATNPMIQANVVAQQQKLAKDVEPARFFPIVSVGFAYSF